MIWPKQDTDRGLAVRATIGLALIALAWCLSFGAFAAGGEPVIIRRTYAGHIDYAAVGASFRNEPNTVDACSFNSPMQSTAVLNIPTGATVLHAYLYYAGSANVTTTPGHTTVVDLASQTNLQLNGVSIPTSAGFNDIDYPPLTDVAGTDVDFFGARRDVTSIVTGPGAYTLSGMVVDTDAAGRTPNQTCLGAWSLVVIYSDTSISKIRVINQFDGFSDFQNSTLDLSPRNFVVDTNSPAGKMTQMTYEGDETLSGNESYQIQIGTGPFTNKTNSYNPVGNQFNSTVTGPDVFDTNTTYGFDLDTYDISAQLATQTNAYTAATRYTTGQDLVLLMAELFETDDKAMADIEVTLADVGTFETNSSGSAQYQITVKNNGDGTGSSASGFATGYIYAYDDLPAGISINSLSRITAPGWDCSATVLSSNQVRCSYDLSTLPGGQLLAGDQLPSIYVSVDVATPASPVTDIARVSLCATTPDSCTTYAGKHTNANQFDPVEDFEPTQDLFSVTAKSSTNNNVDARVTPIITGAPSNLTTSTKSVVDINGGQLNPGDTLQYTITLTDSAGVNATGVAVTDTPGSNVTNFAYQSTDCGGAPAETYTAGTMTVSGITVAGNSSCHVVYTVDVRPSANAGTAINNSATITNGNGSGATPSAPTMLVAGTATGTKVLYLDALGSGTPTLGRNVPAFDSTQSLARNSSVTMKLAPTLAAQLNINSGVIPVSVWVEAATAGNYTMTATLRYDSAGSNTLIGSATVSNVTMATGVANAQLFPFQISLGSNITNLLAGQDITLTLTNSNASAGNAIIHSVTNAIHSSVDIDAATVINVDSVSFFSDAARTIPVTSVQSGQNIYIQAKVSDPFGAFDVHDATLTLVDPNYANEVTDAAMTEDAAAATASTKTFYFAYTVPPASSVAPGSWTARVTGHEGTEGTVAHTNAGTFSATAPSITATYSVSPLTASAGTTLTYTVAISNPGASTSVNINNLAIPPNTQNLVVSSLPSGTNTSSGNLINIQNIVAGTGTTTIRFTVDVDAGVAKGDLVDHTIVLDNMGTTVSATAPSVLIDPFVAPLGNKSLYADDLVATPILHRTPPSTDTTTDVTSQGGAATLTLSPVLQSNLTIANTGTSDFDASVWVSRGASADGQRTIRATLGYTGASSGTIGTSTVTINLQAGSSGAQYIPFRFDIPGDLTVLANSSLILTVTNDTSTAGESITLHSFKDTVHPSEVTFTANSPLTIPAIDFFNNSIDAGGNQITDASPGQTVWVRATVQDPFGATDITAAAVTITDPSGNVTLNAAPMNVPTTQPASGAQKYFQLSHTLTSTLGNWNVSVTAKEGTENKVQATANATLNVNNLKPDLTDSYKSVINTTSNDNANTNAGDVLHYTIALVESGGKNATNVSVTDTIPANTTFVAGSLKAGGVAQPDPTPDINLTGLTVPGSGTLDIEFDVKVNTPVSPGTIISNTANVTNPSGTTTSIALQAEDIVIAGAPAAGTKLLYLKNLNTASPYLTRSQPQTPGTTDSFVVPQNGGSITMNLTPALAKDISIGAVPIDVSLRMNAVGRTNRTRTVVVTLSSVHSGTPTTIGSATQNVNLNTAIASYVFSIPVATATTIAAGDTLQLTVTNNETRFNRDLQLYSYDSTGNRSTVALVPTPVINVDSITFWTGSMGAGTLVTNPDPSGTGVDVYAKIVVSDPFGDADIQAPDAATNPMTVVITNPDGNATQGASTACTAPCFAYAGEDTTNDPPGNATRTFYYIVRIPPSPPATRGTWTAQVTANEGLEGTVSHVAADSFSTKLRANLSTSTKTYTNVGDVNPGDTLTYVITLINSGELDANNASLSDQLQTSPVSLTFSSASTTCTDQGGAGLPNPAFSGGSVDLANITVTAGSSCTVTINTTVGTGTPGDTLDNAAVITNPDGPGGTPVAPTILLSASQIPVAGNKELYFTGLGGASTLTRTIPTTTGQVTLAGNGGSTSLTQAGGTTRAMTLSSGAVDVNVNLASGGNRSVTIELQVNPGGAGYQTIDSQQQTANFGTTSPYTFHLNNAAAISLPTGSLFRVIVTNNTNRNNRTVTLSQVTTAPWSELVAPLVDSLAVTALDFYSVSGNDQTGNPGCAPNCGVQVNPAIVATGGTIWARATIQDGFGSNDVNTGCDGVTSTNCPTITLTDPTNTQRSPATLSFLQNPDTASRQFEFQVNPAGFGLEGIWQAKVTGNEGVEGVISASRIATFERYGPPVLTVVKTASGTTRPGDIVTYTSNVSNTGTGPATQVVLDNDISAFLSLAVTASGGSWTSLFSLAPGSYSLQSEQWDNGTGTYTYNPATTCGAPIAANSPCFDPNIKKWRIQLNGRLDKGAGLTLQYRAKVQ